MTRFLLSFLGFAFSLALGIAIMINGWGVTPKSWSWIIFGSIAGSFIGALFQLHDD